MDTKSLKEIRKRIEPTLENFKTIYGCYVNAAGAIVSSMEIPVLDMSDEEREMFSKLLKKALSGKPDDNLRGIEISDSGDEYRLLLSLKESHLENAEMRNILYERIVENLNLEEKSYEILVAADTYDLISREGDEEDWSEESVTQFEYFICSICEVKDSKAMLKYQAKPQEFRGVSTGSTLSTPILGFMYPAFVDRSADILSVFYYSKKPEECHNELIQGLFGVEDIPLAASLKKQAFYEALETTLGDECTLGVVNGIHAMIEKKNDADKEGDNSEKVEILPTDIEEILKKEAVREDKIQEFSKVYKETLGGALPASNLLSNANHNITSTDASIIVPKENALRIKIQEIDGIRYFLVPVGADVKVNGVSVTTG